MRSNFLNRIFVSVLISLFFLMAGSIDTLANEISNDELLELVNTERRDRGVHELVIDERLNTAAMLKATDMINNDYWAHYSPDNKSPWSFMEDTGYYYVNAGENLAKGFYKSKDVVSSWMKSDFHRENILSTKYNDVGFAVVRGEIGGKRTTLVVQLLGSSPTPKVVVKLDTFQFSLSSWIESLLSNNL